MHILIVPDSFKESLSAKSVAEAIKEGFSKAIPEATFDLLPIGDGGEGTVAALVASMKLSEYERTVTGPFGEAVTMKYARKGDVALFEMADLVGLASISSEKRNPLTLDTRGLGELILYLAKEDVRQIYIGVGGSATNDGGIGMAAGLGYEFFDKDNHLLQAKGSSLDRVARISADKVPAILENLDIQILTDVMNPLCGENGATYVFGGQKGLPDLLFSQVDHAMATFYKQANPTIFSLAAAGAGGGMAAGLVTFAHGKIVSGIDTCLNLLDFDNRVKKADLVIVGEGRMDQQSLSGKAPIGVARRTPINIPVIAICGSLRNDLPDFPVENIQAAFPIISQVEPLIITLDRAEENLVRTAQNIGNLLRMKI
ncbi:glycerate kinase [Streptococcus sp. SI1]|uniref:Glycerate kinase n=1 Tax=Streptococcus intermedius TaxID=1338 RepID=A0AAD1FK30_STRIT|nr:MULTISPECIES: glycerate kinase [Streptococcus]MDN5016256.1 glycerate kinase [Streptococcus sp. SI1]BAW17191.1 glycerate kinase [Streptococcus intermedius]